jgi:hypothetical protein
MASQKIFISYTRTDKDWAWWIGCTLRDGGHTPFVHEWELPLGGNIPAWMEKRLGEADRAIGVFSDAYCSAVFSTAERNAAIWRDEYGETGFFVPIEVRKVAKWPVFTAPLSRLSLVGLGADEAEKRLLAAFEPPAPPTVRPPFPGIEGVIVGMKTIGPGIGLDLGGLAGGLLAGRSKSRRAKPSAATLARRHRAAAAGDVTVPEAEPLPVARPDLPPSA